MNDNNVNNNVVLENNIEVSDQVVQVDDKKNEFVGIKFLKGFNILLFIYAVIGAVCSITFRFLGSDIDSDIAFQIYAYAYLFPMAYGFPFVYCLYTVIVDYKKNILFKLLDAILTFVLFDFVSILMLDFYSFGPICYYIYDFNKYIYYLLGLLYSFIPYIYYLIFKKNILNIRLKTVIRFCMVIIMGFLLFMLSSCGGMG